MPVIATMDPSNSPRPVFFFDIDNCVCYAVPPVENGANNSSSFILEVWQPDTHLLKPSADLVL